MVKKIRWGALFAVIFFIILGYLQYGRKVEVKNTRIINYQYGYTEYINLVANKLYIADKSEFAKEVINIFVDNSFDDVKFSFDLNGYPSDLIITVYMNKWNDNKAFEIYCVFDSGNSNEKRRCFDFEIKE